jgi:hypothetical protein
MAHKTAIANGHTNNSIGIWTNGSVKNCKIMGLGTGMVFSWGIGTIESIDLEVCNTTGILIGYAPLPYYQSDQEAILPAGPGSADVGTFQNIGM